MHAELQLDNQICFRLYTATRLVTQAYTPMLLLTLMMWPIRQIDHQLQKAGRWLLSKWRCQ